MIVGYISDPVVRGGLRLAAHPEEDVIVVPALADEALVFGYPRLVVVTGDGDLPELESVSERPVPFLRITAARVARWELERRESGLPVSRVEWTGDRLRDLVERDNTTVTWVDRAISDLSRAAGSPLPSPLRSLARRVMEFPSHYDDLHPLAETCATTRGALKARFRRKNLPSPYAYLRWFRIMAVANALSDRDVTVAQVASRLGYTSDGNLCRTMVSLTRLTPTEVRTLHGWNRLLISFAWQYLGAEALEAWRELEDLFEIRVA